MLEKCTPMSCDLLIFVSFKSPITGLTPALLSYNFAISLRISNTEITRCTLPLYLRKRSVFKDVFNQDFVGIR